MTPAEETYLDMAKYFEAQGNYEKALVWYKKIRGDSDIYEIIGEYLYLGRGCGKDESEAGKYFEQAAELGNLDALCNLALCIKELDKKAYLYEMAAEQGSVYAMNMAGIIAEDMGEAESYSAKRWFKKAADCGSETGCYNYAMYCDDKEERMEYLKRSAAKDCVVALETYIQYLKDGIYCIKDEVKAAELESRLKTIRARQ